MKVRTAAPVALCLIVAGGALAPAVAQAKPAPITESYTAQGAPVPSPLVGDPAPEDANSCTNPALEGISTTTKTITTKGPGTLVVGLTGFAGDWDITVTDADGLVGEGEGTTTGGEAPVIGGGNGSLGADNTEKLVVKLKKATTLNIGVCNYVGGPTADAKYTFTYR